MLGLCGNRQTGANQIAAVAKETGAVDWPKAEEQYTALLCDYATLLLQDRPSHQPTMPPMEWTWR